MIELTRKYKQTIKVLLHVAIIALSFVLSFLTRFDMKISPYIPTILETLVPLIVLRIAAYWFFGAFGGLFMYSGLVDMIKLVKGAILGTVLFTLYAYVFEIFLGEGFPRSIFFIDLGYNIMLAAGMRVAFRLYSDRFGKGRRTVKGNTKSVIIAGAGRAGEMILREMHNNPSLKYRAIGFVDDDRSKHNRTIHGVRVLGYTHDIVSIASKKAVDEVVIAIPSARRKSIRRILATCERARVKVRTLPHISDIMHSSVSVKQLRNVAITDILGRDPVQLDTTLLHEQINDRVVLVTGAAGSIGSELVRQLIRLEPRRIVLYERSETELYYLELELTKKYPGAVFVPFVGDITDETRVRQCMEQYAPELVFHAAAYKHVPMMEINPTEAVKNNVFGTRLVARLAVEYGVKRFVFISTDKAVRPTNVMGATKRVAELILQQQSADDAVKTKFVAVRFGNVLGSNGSVIKLFNRQIAEGGPVTVTHPEVTRYFMTIPEAAQLVIQAGGIADDGQIFLLEMGEPVKIRDLAENLIRLSGLVPGEDIEIRYSGLRPGEKLYEELLIDGEDVTKTHYDKIWVLRSERPKTTWLNGKLELLEKAAIAALEPEEIKSLLNQIVPEYKYRRGSEPHERIEGDIVKAAQL